MKLTTAAICFIFQLLLPQTSYSQSNWTINPFNQKVFIENKGQYNKATKTKNKILFMTELGKVNIFFTKNELVYTYNEVKPHQKEEEEKEREEDENPKYKIHKLSTVWEGANTAVTIKAEEKQTYFYASTVDGINTIQSAVYKKLVYQNLYNGIDVEYYFPENDYGLKYNIIIHPGADITQVKINYKDAKKIAIDGEGNITITSSLGAVIDHAPIASINGRITSSSFVINKKTVGFKLNEYFNKNETVIIDPWVTNPAFAGGGWSYDLDYDNQGNVYVYGDWNKKLIKLNNAGVIQWTFDLGGVAGGFFGSSFNKYGDFAVDKINGTSFVLRGLGASIMKFSTSGNVIITKDFATTDFNESWKIAYNKCTSKLIIGSGGASSNMRHQIFAIDTNMNFITSANVGFADEAHDAALLAINPKGDTCYMALASRGITANAFDNILVKLPASILSPTTYFVQSGFLFAEQSPKYNNGNGMNGMIVSNNWLYMYDGATLKRVNKNTGVADISLATNTTPFRWAGLDVDECDNLYVGNKTKIDVYNSTMNVIAQITATDTIYDLMLGANDTILYACGRGFVSSINVDPALIPSISKIISPASCNTCNGNATATLNICGAQNTSVNYVWSNGQTTQTATGLCSGIYTVTVSLGVCGNQYTDTVQIFSTVAGTLSVSNAISHITCNGNNNGSIALTPSGGITPYSYAWSTTGINGATANSLTAGTYSCTITDGGCSSKIVSVIITEPSAIIINTTQITSASCGQNNGSAVTAVATGGTGTISYSWSNGNSGLTASNLSAQTYTLTVKDANNCTATNTITIGNTAGASITSIIKGDALCNGGTGSATVNISGGGSGNYTYSWAAGQSTTTNSTTQQLNNLTSGTYTVTVIDGSCSITSVVSITQPTPIVASAIQSTPASCGLSNGVAIATASGGNNSNYNYIWSNGTTTITATNLAAATYVVTVTDGNNCTTTTSVNINNSPAPIINSLIPVNPLCNGATGTANVTATGTGTLTYVWSNGNTTTTANNLSAGNYNITVTDGNGCKAIQSFSITEPTAITPSNPIITNASCNQTNGSIALSNPSGGVSPYNYSWSNGQTTQNVSNLSSQTYSLTITDNNACSTTTSVTVGNSNGTSILSATATNPLCNGGTGSATVTITPSTAPYTYSWSNGVSTITTATSNQELLTSNSYTLTVTDANNCSTTTTVQINQPALLSIATLTKTDASCNQSNGSINITATGGTSPYTYSWTNGVIAITTGTSNQSLLTSNTYTVTVTDANNCSTTTSTTIANINSNINAAVTTNITSNTITEGETVILSAGGGISYSWTPSNTLSCATCPVTIANPAATTTYTLIVKDNLGCADTTDITINVKKPCTGEEDVFIANVFSPNNDGKNDVLQIQGNGLSNIYFSIYDRWGNLVFETRDQAQGWDGSVNGSKANAGTYVYYLKATCKKTLQEIILKGNVSVVR